MPHIMPLYFSLNTNSITDQPSVQKWIDLDELNPMVWVPSIVRRRIDFSLAVFELGALGREAVRVARGD